MHFSASLRERSGPRPAIFPVFGWTLLHLGLRSGLVSGWRQRHRLPPAAWYPSGDVVFGPVYPYISLRRAILEFDDRNDLYAY